MVATMLVRIMTGLIVGFAGGKANEVAGNRGCYCEIASWASQGVN
jgi:hypothetical protein